MNEKIKIAIVDDNIVYRQNLVQQIEKITHFDVTNQSSNGKELITALSGINTEVILLDLEMPIMDGFETLDFLKANNPKIKTIVLTIHNEPDISMRLIEKGAKGFVFKNEDITEIINAIYIVVNGGHRFGDYDLPHTLKFAKNKKRVSHLSKHGCSDRELEVIKFYCQGYTFKEIGEKLFISDRTAQKHIENAMKKVCIFNSIRFVNYCTSTGLNNFKNG